MAFNIGAYAKSIVSGVTAFGGAYTLANSDGVVSQSEWIGIAVATVVGVFTVYAVPNAPAPAVTVEPEPTADELWLEGKGQHEVVGE
jgi:hypothetical protein